MLRSRKRAFRFGDRRAAAVLALGLAAAPGWVAADDLVLLRRDGVVSGFASLGDLQPVTPADPTPTSAVRAAAPAPRALPTESFTHLKAAVPLLVGDIESSRSVAVVLPMSGRSVGAAPQRDWIRPVPGR